MMDCNLIQIDGVYKCSVCGFQYHKPVRRNCQQPKPAEQTTPLPTPETRVVDVPLKQEVQPAPQPLKKKPCNCGHKLQPR